MKDASKFKWPKGLKRTKTRESVLSVLEVSKSPLSAREIYSEIERMGRVFGCLLFIGHWMPSLRRV